MFFQERIINNSEPLLRRPLKTVSLSIIPKYLLMALVVLLILLYSNKTGALSTNQTTNNESAIRVYENLSDDSLDNSSNNSLNNVLSTPEFPDYDLSIKTNNLPEEMLAEVNYDNLFKITNNNHQTGERESLSITLNYWLIKVIDNKNTNQSIDQSIEQDNNQSLLIFNRSIIVEPINYYKSTGTGTITLSSSGTYKLCGKISEVFKRINDDNREEKIKIIDPDPTNNKACAIIRTPSTDKKCSVMIILKTDKEIMNYDDPLTFYHKIIINNDVSTNGDNGDNGDNGNNGNNVDDDIDDNKKEDIVYYTDYTIRTEDNKLLYQSIGDTTNDDQIIIFKPPKETLTKENNLFIISAKIRTINCKNNYEESGENSAKLLLVVKNNHTINSAENNCSTENNESSIDENQNSIINKTSFLKIEQTYGTIKPEKYFRVKISARRGETARKSIELYVINNRGETISKRTKMLLWTKGVDYQITTPILMSSMKKDLKQIRESISIDEKRSSEKNYTNKYNKNSCFRIIRFYSGDKIKTYCEEFLILKGLGERVEKRVLVLVDQRKIGSTGKDQENNGSKKAQSSKEREDHQANVQYALLSFYTLNKRVNRGRINLYTRIKNNLNKSVLVDKKEHYLIIALSKIVHKNYQKEASKGSFNNQSALLIKKIVRIDNRSFKDREERIKSTIELYNPDYNPDNNPEDDDRFLLTASLITIDNDQETRINQTAQASLTKETETVKKIEGLEGVEEIEKAEKFEETKENYKNYKTKEDNNINQTNKANSNNLNKLTNKTNIGNESKFIKNVNLAYHNEVINKGNDIDIVDQKAIFLIVKDDKIITNIKGSLNNMINDDLINVSLIDNNLVNSFRINDANNNNNKYDNKYDNSIFDSFNTSLNSTLNGLLNKDLDKSEVKRSNKILKEERITGRLIYSNKSLPTKYIYSISLAILLLATISNIKKTNF